ncbi:MAG: tRNA threonylcarbamoyladenosine dehydratase [Clostridia bacterium]|nr:tRNA threonylcarbamoyladenosine dehydratase [Clostridia bacterium]
MNSQFSRTENLIGADALKKLQNCHIAVFGVGGVGGYTVEALARAGVGTIDLIDSDCVDITNLNRQIIALHSTIGKLKVEVMRDRVLDINPNTTVNIFPILFLPENSTQFDFSKYDYVIDAIDTVTAKIELAVRCQESGTPIIASMGTGNKLDPTRFEVTDIYKTSVCPLAKVMRYELKKHGVKKLKVLYSKEEPIKNQIDPHTPMSISYVPSSAGLIIAGEVIKDIIKKEP